MTGAVNRIKHAHTNTKAPTKTGHVIYTAGERPGVVTPGHNLTQQQPAFGGKTAVRAFRTVGNVQATEKITKKLSPDLFERWHESLANLYANTDHQRVPELLMKAVGQLLDFDSGLICVMGQSISPIAIYDDVPAALRAANVDSYYSGAYLLDPLYQAGVSGIGPGPYRLREIVQPGFFQSEYFRRYFRASGMTDEVVTLTYLPDNLFMHTSYSIFDGSLPLNKSRIEWLRLAQPLIDRILIKYWQEYGSRQIPGTSRLSSELGLALDVFGASVLTERECQIIRLYLKGHSTRSISEHLGISQHTVCMHRKNAYAKLDVRSQFELFHLFIDSLGCFDSDHGEDPLRKYMNPSRAAGLQSAS